jgi:HK97 family phage portal protein
LIVRTRGGGHREMRMPSPLAQDYIPTPAEFGTWLSAATGERITVDKAAGLPAVLEAIWQVAESTGSLPLRVYRGTGAQKRPAERDWRWTLLHDRPNDEQGPFDFWQDVAACIETHGNAYLLKDVAGGIVLNLYPLDPAIVRVRRNQRTGVKEFVLPPGGTDRDQRSGELVLTAAEVLHVRGPTLKGGDVGLTPISLARDALASARARHTFEGELYRNHAVPPAVIESPEPPNREKAKNLASIWAQTHGAGGRGKTGVLMGGATLKAYGLTMEDAQFVESHRFSVEDVARMFRIPASLLSAGDLAVVEQDTKRFLSFGLGSRLMRIQSALRADMDLFGDTDLYPEFYTRDFIRLDAATEAEVRHKDVQSGVLLVDEARAEQGRPPLPEGAGQIPQVTPVGGAPNPALSPSNGNGASDQ